jgi:hypothetical protein
MVAVCLLGQIPFALIDSSTVLRKLENNLNATVAKGGIERARRWNLVVHLCG